jgi:hypothetical protein
VLVLVFQPGVNVMAYADWRIKGLSLSTCNCDYGCPCQFNALPTHGDCRAAVAMHIDEGHFEDVSLAGTTWVGMFDWPGPIHEGNGEAFVVIDPSASDDQRQALLTILSGQETEPGATIFNVFAGTLTKMHDPQFLPITWEGDLETRKGGFSIDGIVNAKATPIVNASTGAEQRARVNLPAGFEYDVAEYCSSTVDVTGPVKYSTENAHAHFCTIHMTAQGVVR